MGLIRGGDFVRKHVLSLFEGNIFVKKHKETHKSLDKMW